MKSIDELIEELCPDGVEYKLLGELFDHLSGFKGSSKKWAESGNCRFIDYMNVYLHPKVCVDDLKWATVKSLEQNTLEKGDVLFTSASETPDECALAGEIEDEIPRGILLDDHLFCLRIKQQHKSAIAKGFLKYVFRSAGFRSLIIKVVRGVTRFYVVKNEFLSKLSIPLPPLTVQEKIVGILDSFTKLIDELELELAARRKQDAHYRDKLLTFGDDVERKQLGELGEFYGGLTGKSKVDFENGNAKFISYMNVYSNCATRLDVSDKVKVAPEEKQNQIQLGDVLFTGSSETLEECAMASVVTTDVVEPIYLNSFCFGFRLFDKSIYLPKFLKYLLRSSETRHQLSKTANGVTRFNVSKIKMAKVVIPRPSLPEQRRIVEVLDKFDALCNDETAGLGAEIAARKKQYEYYRDRLLTFKRKESV